MIRLDKLSFSYKNGEQKVIKNMDLTISEGECLTVLGPSGCGKSTLLHLISGLIKPDQGCVRYEDRVVRQPIREIAFLTQDCGLLPWKTVKENLRLPLKIHHQKITRQEWLKLVSCLGLEQELDKYPAQLSGGQAQRAALGRTILAKSKVILMDEPFSALDIGNKESLQGFLNGIIKERNMTAVIVTHNIEEAIYMGDRIAVFDSKMGQIGKILDNHDPKNGALVEKIEKCMRDVLKNEKMAEYNS